MDEMSSMKVRRMPSGGMEDSGVGGMLEYDIYGHAATGSAGEEVAGTGPRQPLPNDRGRAAILRNVIGGLNGHNDLSDKEKVDIISLIAMAMLH